MDERFDVVVVGGGNAGFSAAHAAAERGRRVLVLEKGALGQEGGNSYYTAGAVRVAHDTTAWSRSPTCSTPTSGTRTAICRRIPRRRSMPTWRR